MERVVQLKISIKVPATTDEQTSEFRTSSRWRRRYGLLIAAGAYGLAGHQEPSAGPSSSPGQGETSVCQWGMFQLVPNVSGGSWSWSLCVRSSGRPCQSCEAATAAQHRKSQPIVLFGTFTFVFVFSGGSCSTHPSLESVYVQTPFVVPGSSSGQSTASMKLD